MWAICHIETCKENGWPHNVGDLTWTDPDGVEHTMQAFCGMCSNEYTDIRDIEPPTPPDPDAELNAEPDESSQ